jgi:photosystem II stability/assembly factor-like uncharacterized protein
VFLRYPLLFLEDTVVFFRAGRVPAFIFSFSLAVAALGLAQQSSTTPKKPAKKGSSDSGATATSAQKATRSSDQKAQATKAPAKPGPQPEPLAEINPDLLKSLSWRAIGPYRGGRTRAVSGVPSQPGTFYIGVCNGGVWKTNDYGRTWTPIFDDQPTGSIGAVAVAPSDPNIIYVASGEGLHRPDLSVGDGIYKSTDAGKTWTHLGLRDGQQIPALAIDPKDPNKVFAAVAGHPYGPNPERGIYRSTDGGQNWQKVLTRPENEVNVGGSDVVIDPANPQNVYATLWEAREGPWENGSWVGSGGGIFKSTDGGDTFHQLTGGLPADIVQAHIDVAPSDPNKIIAMVASKTMGQGFMRSADGGQHWTIGTNDTRPLGRIGGGDLSVPKFDPKNPDVIYVTSTVTWKSTDAGQTWTGFRGAPGGDDYQGIWISPNDSKNIILVSDQGAIVTVNGGESWSSWYNQPTAQLYHVNADNAFPYRLCSGQQESGSVCIASRGNDGQVTIREWHPVSAEEYGYVVPDPTDPDIVYGGKLTRYDRRTGQAQNIMPVPFRNESFRVLRTAPIVFSPLNPKLMFFGANTLWKTTDRGNSWTRISPDLSRSAFYAPASVGKYRTESSSRAIQRGVIYAVAPSPLDINLIWAGTDDGQIHITTDGGGHWTNITPQGMAAFEKVSIIEASHFDPQTAYAAINTLRLDDLRPHILRTRDGGKTWTEIVKGIPENENVNAVREDPIRRGMLFAGTERAVYVSFDDGDHWQSLRLNMAASSVRDVIIKDDDLVAATHGRGFWILDDITPLRQFEPRVISADAYLFKPQTATRVRWSMNSDTPLPPDFPSGPNPPDGAVINYYLKSAASGPVTLEIKDAAGKTVRKFSSENKAEPIDPKLNIPTYWVRPPEVLSSAPGTHRFLWNMHTPDLPGVEPEYPISAVPHNTVPQPTGLWVAPGTYTIVLTANGKAYSQPLTIRMDPRVKTPNFGLELQYKASQQLYEHLLTLSPAVEQATDLRKQLVARMKDAGQPSDLWTNLSRVNDGMQYILGAANRRPGPGREEPALANLKQHYLQLLNILQETDDTPTTQVMESIKILEGDLGPIWKQWEEVKTKDIPDLNNQLKQKNLPELKLLAVEPSPHAAVSAQDKDEE